MKKLVKYLAEYTVEHLLEVLISTIVSFLKTQSVKENRLKIFISSFLVALLLLKVVWAAFRHIVRYKFCIHSQKTTVSASKRQMRVESDYKVSTSRAFQTHMFIGISSFRSQQFTFRVKPKRFKLNEIKSDGNQYEYDLSFPSPISLWQKPISFTTVFRSKEKNVQFDSSYSYKVCYPTKKLDIFINLSDGAYSKKAKAISFLVHENEDQAKCEELSYEGGFHYAIEHPKVGYTYNVRWEWL